MSTTLLANTTIAAAATYQIELENCGAASIEVVATVNSTAKTAVCGILAVGILGGVTYTAVKLASGLDAAGNSYSVAYTPGATAGSEVVTVVGTAISVQIETGVSTITQVRTAVNANGTAAALVTATGTSATTVATTAATLISAMSTPTTGVNSKFSVADDTIAISAHGFYTGLVVQATKSGAAFPTGISASTDYFVYVLSSSSIALFDTLANCLAAVPTNSFTTTSTGVIDITADGTVSSTITLTPVSVSGCSYKLQKSNQYRLLNTTDTAATWVDLVAGETDSVVTNNITATATSAASYKNCTSQWLRIAFAISAGTVNIKVYGTRRLSR